MNIYFDIQDINPNNHLACKTALDINFGTSIDLTKNFISKINPGRSSTCMMLAVVLELLN